MKNQFRISRPAKYSIFTLTVFVCLSFIWTAFKPQPQPDNDLFEMKKNLDIFYDVYGKVEQMYVDEPQPGALMKTGIDAMLKSLDPYTVYIPESKIEDFKVQSTGIYGGIGAVISTHDGAITVVEAEPKEPAFEAGLRVGDILTAINGKTLEGKTHGDVNTVIKGQPGTTIDITYTRPGNSEKKTVTVTREKIGVPVVPYYGMIDDKTGYIKLNSFTQTAYGEVKNAYLELQKSGMKQFVLDLRGNGGGLVNEAVDIVGMFVDKGEEIVIMKGRMPESNKSYKTQLKPIDTEIPIAVLVDENSASASEIVCGSLQDLDRAVIVGTRTYGKGLVQQTHSIKYNSIIKLTVAKYQIPSGRCVQKIDYFNKQDGKAQQVPDSLLSEFKTRNGRMVMDGSGVLPDIIIEPEEISNMVKSLVENHIIFNYATEYSKKHDSISKPKSFKISDTDFSGFKSFALTKEFTYTSESLMALNELKKLAKEEQYAGENINKAMSALEKDFKSDPAEDIVRYKEQIVSLLENEIVSRFHYNKGRMEYALEQDKFLSEAINVLNNRSQYNKVLGSL